MYVKTQSGDGMKVVDGATIAEIDSDSQWDVQTIVTPYGVRIVKSHSATQSEHIIEIDYRYMVPAEHWRNV